ncbi:hypothetical protein O181_092414 [Austropuccinia psidii MF-1]|uniref:Integrase zinc-binding domain-containing protein n=1 Tax=Austropuccinia psidii MF-1 TaxID=1389203 RepID=A0A9Q3IZE8_9BASI|nr:hypothetical protein [Austropuccinia psidii MF-1]
MKYCKDPSLSFNLDEIWKEAYYEGRFHLLSGILYHRTKHTCVMTLTDRTLINTILHECHDIVVSGHLLTDRALERAKTCSFWPNWRNNVAEYCQTCDRRQKENRAASKKFGVMIQIQEPKSPLEIVHMDWLTASPPGGDRSFNECLLIADRYSETPIALLFHKDDTAMATAIMIWNRVISHTSSFQNIISDTDSKFTTALWKNLLNSLPPSNRCFIRKNDTNFRRNYQNILCLWPRIQKL